MEKIESGRNIKLSKKILKDSLEIKHFGKAIIKTEISSLLIKKNLKKFKNLKMKNIDPKTPIWQLTVEEFLEVSKNINPENKYEYGLKGLAKILGCSISKASEVKSSGLLDKAIVQNGNIIIIDKEKVLELFDKK